MGCNTRTLSPERMAILESIPDSAGRKFRHESYACFTNGWFLVALECDNPMEGTKAPGNAAQLLSLDRDYLPGTFDIESPARLVEFCKLPKPCSVCRDKGKRVCPECHGNKTVTCECECGDLSHSRDCIYCSRTGTVVCLCALAPLPGRILGRVFNRLLIRKALESSGAEGPIRVSVSAESNGGAMLNLRFEGGMILVMGMWREPDKAVDEFPAKAPAEIQEALS